MNRMRKCNDEVYQLAKVQALVKKLKNKRFRPFCLCLPGVMFVTRGSKNSLFSVFDFLSNKWDSYGNQNGTLLCQHFYGGPRRTITPLVT